MKVLVTGASGFIGGALMCHLGGIGGINVVGSDRVGGKSGVFKVGNLSSEPALAEVLTGVDVVVHTAGRAHEVGEKNTDSLIDFRRINVEGTLALAHQASIAGVRRLIYISTVKVNGESTQHGAPFRECDTPLPVGPYAVSKLEAEKGLLSISAETGIEVVIIRPSLVYGTGVKANFLSLVLAVKKRRVLPIGSLNNRRSFVSLDNLINFIILCMDHPKASNQVFLVSDGHDLSVPELVNNLAQLLKVPSRLITVPYSVLKFFATLFGKGEPFQRISNNLQVDISKANHLLGWKPPFSVRDGMYKMVNSFDDSNCL